MNEVLDKDAFIAEINQINDMLASLLNSFKEVGNYFERYLTQVSKDQFSHMIRRIQMAITDSFDARTDETAQSLWNGI
jgi:t-SNARE complex subunit (syntaxin)